MSISNIRIATRNSPLALWQAHFVGQSLQKINPDIKITFNKITTKGDKILDKSLSKIGGKGLFIKELEQSLLRQESDIAVHSLKDMPSELPEGLSIGAICQREDPRDCLICGDGVDIKTLEPGSIIGTSSLRRQSQILAMRQDIKVQPLRGNVNTRLKKLEAGIFNAIILASAGVTRLGLKQHINHYFPINEFLPAVGQGALAIECREDDKDILPLLAALDDPQTKACVTAERSMNHFLNGSCQTPIAGYACIQNNSIQLQGLVGSPDGKTVIRAAAQGDIHAPEILGQTVAKQLLAKGAAAILIHTHHT